MRKVGRPRKAQTDVPAFMRPLPDFAPPGKELPEMTASEADSILAEARRANSRAEDKLRDFDREEQLARAAEQDMLDQWRAHAPLSDLLKSYGASALNVGLGMVARAPLSIHPVGVIANAGITAGDLANQAVDVYETINMRRKGTPRERAEKAYGEGIRARIERRGPVQYNPNGRKFR